MAKKLRVGIVFGGRSGEHEISLLSAASVIGAIDRRKFEVVPIGISKRGQWLIGAQAGAMLAAGAASSSPRPAGEALPPLPPQAGKRARAGRLAAAAADLREGIAGGASELNGQRLDVVFPVLHGTFGEDGTIQGFFELADVPYVGSGVLGSAVGMDKDVMKRLFLAAGLPITPYAAVLRSRWRSRPRQVLASLEAALRYPMFVKPANLGSSVGISKAHDRSELGPALDLAGQFDRKIVVEQGVGGPRTRARELEVAVLGNDDPRASVAGEIIPAKEFYDYEAKYLSDGSIPVIPAKIGRAESAQVRKLALEAFRACDLAGMARVDFLMEPAGRGRIFLNEVNTLPGFTAISMYPKLWQASGLSYAGLITNLIELALERHRERAETRFSLP